MCPDLETIAFAEISSALHEFDCSDGYPMSYHTTPSGETHRYVTLGFIGDGVLTVARALASELRAVRRSLPADEVPKLYMRTRPMLERDIESDRVKIRMRLAVPGANWSEFRVKHEGAPYLPALTSALPPPQ